jgi:ubiquinol-cytochrome c reductase cytochrome c subunit
MGMSGRRVVVPLFTGLLAAGLLAIGLHTAGATEQRRGQGTGDAERGQRLFLVGCAYCHGQNGDGTAQGPDLRGVGAAAADFQLSTGRMPNTAPDRQSVTKRSPVTSRKAVSFSSTTAPHATARRATAAR